MIQPKRERFFAHKFKETFPRFALPLNRPFLISFLCSDIQLLAVMEMSFNYICHRWLLST